MALHHPHPNPAQVVRARQLPLHLDQTSSDASSLDEFSLNFELLLAGGVIRRFQLPPHWLVAAPVG